MFEVARWHKRELRTSVERWGGWDDKPKPDFKLDDSDDEKEAAGTLDKTRLGKAAARAGRAAAKQVDRAKRKVKKVKQMVMRSVKKILTRTVMYVVRDTRVHIFFKRTAIRRVQAAMCHVTTGTRSSSGRRSRRLWRPSRTVRPPRRSL